MTNRLCMIRWRSFSFVMSCLWFSCVPLIACTRCVYLGANNTVIVARSMDWAEDTKTNLWAFPRGMNRDGAAGSDSLRWTSKYGSLVCSFYECASVDGINEKGLVANVLYLVESDYGKPEDDKPTISIAAWAQYALDTFATVDEAVAALSREPFTIIAPVLPGGIPAQGHLSISDPSGDSAIFEYVKGKLVVHHGRQFQVMTNSPTFDQQLALNTYWQAIGAAAMLPGTSRAADRFVRASHYIGTIPADEEESRALASVLSVLRNASVPLGVATPGQPNIASTLWRTMYDQKNRILYFDSATSPTIFWVPVAELEFAEGAPVKTLTLTGGKTFGGNAAKEFREARPYAFLPALTK